jgi:hypothetical protein
MLVATLVRDDSDGQVVLLRPRYEDELLRNQFNSSPIWIQPIETFLASGEQSATNNIHEELFGTAGGNGPDIYRNSIKFHTWFCIAQFVFMATLVTRDMKALLEQSTIMAHPDAVLPEIKFLCFWTVLSMIQLTIMTPQTFLCFSQATSLESMTKEWALTKAIQDPKVQAFRDDIDASCPELACFKQVTVIDPTVD